MYEILEKDHRSYKIYITVAVEYDEWEDAYSGGTIKDQLTLQLIKGRSRWKSSKINVSYDNMENFVEDIEDCIYQFTTPNGDTLNINSISAERSKLLAEVKKIKNRMDRIDLVDIPPENAVIIPQNNFEDIHETLSEENSHTYMVLFGGLPVSLELIGAGDFEFLEHLRKYDDFITCQYCGESGHIDGYEVTGEKPVIFDRPNNELCEECAHRINEKCDIISEDEDLIKRIVANKI